MTAFHRPLAAAIAEQGIPLTADMAALSDERLAGIEARAKAATPGPWCTDSWEIYQGAEYTAGAEWLGETCRAGEMDGSRADAEFVAAARTDVPELLAEVQRMRAELADFSGRVNELESRLCECEPVREHRDFRRPAFYQHAADCPVNGGEAR